MATYNYAGYIAQAIQSVVDQTFADWELVIVDDGSRDNTSDIVQPFLSDARIRYHQQENQGQPKAKNAGIRLARGKLIAFLDADDVWLDSKLAKQVAMFEADPDLGVAYTRLQRMSPDGEPFGPEGRRLVRGYILDEAFRRTVPPFSSTMVRREVFDDVGLFDESIPLAIDYELWLRVALKYRFDYVDEPLLFYRTGHANLSKRSAERLDLVLNQIVPKFVARPGVREKLGKRLIAEVISNLYLCLAREHRKVAPLTSLRYQAKAFCNSPWYFNTWRSVFNLWISRPLGSALRTISPKSSLQGSPNR